MLEPPITEKQKKYLDDLEPAVSHHHLTRHQARRQIHLILHSQGKTPVYKPKPHKHIYKAKVHSSGKHVILYCSCGTIKQIALRGLLDDAKLRVVSTGIKGTGKGKP